MVDGRAEEYGPAVAGLFFPVPHDRIIEDRPVQDLVRLAHVEVTSGCVDAGERIAHPEIHRIGPGRHENSPGNQGADLQLITDVAEGLPQGAAIPPARGRRQPEDLYLRIDAADISDDVHVAGRSRAVALVDDEMGDVADVSPAIGTSQGLDAAEHQLSGPVVLRRLAGTR